MRSAFVGVLLLMALAIQAQQVEIAAEKDFREAFPGCELGAMPPFGNLYGMDVYVDPSLSKDEEIAFNAGTHHELIRMGYDDFEKLGLHRLLELVGRDLPEIGVAGLADHGNLDRMLAGADVDGVQALDAAALERLELLEGVDVMRGILAVELEPHGVQA